MYRNTLSNDPPGVTPRRMPDGAIDTDFYLRQAQARRADVVRAILSCLAHSGIRAWACIKAKMQGRAARRQLASLSARELKDLGLNSGDIEAVASGAYFIDPTRSPRSRERQRKCA